MSPTNREIFKELVREAIQEAGYHRCPLSDIGISTEEHKQHHSVIRKFLKDMNHIRTAFLAGVVVTLSGGLFGLLWLGIQERLFK